MDARVETCRFCGFDAALIRPWRPLMDKAEFRADLIICAMCRRCQQCGYEHDLSDPERMFWHVDRQDEHMHVSPVREWR